MLSIAQDEEQPADPSKIVFAEPPKSIEEAMERREKANSDATAEFQKAEQVFAEKTAKADKEFVGFLSQLARQAVASGDLPGASKAWEKVLEVDPHDKSATEFFGTINRPDIPKAKIEWAIKSDTSDKKRIEFVTESGRRFRKRSNGVWSDTLLDGTEYPPLKELARTSGRVTLQRLDKNEQLHQLDGDRFLWREEKNSNLWRELEKGTWVK